MFHPKYGYVKCKLDGNPKLQSKRLRHEIQYHLHISLKVEGSAADWDVAINVGTNDADDLLRYKLVYNFAHDVTKTLQAAAGGFADQTGATALPALDFLRSDVLAGTGPWRDSDVMDGSDQPEPVAGLKRLLIKAAANNLDVYVFGRTYTHGGPGIHDIHMNQGSSGKYVNDGETANDEQNDIWQDGAVLVDLKEEGWAAYFTAFTQQDVPTDDLGNAKDGSHGMSDADDGSLAK